MLLLTSLVIRRNAVSPLKKPQMFTSVLILKTTNRECPFLLS